MTSAVEVGVELWRGPCPIWTHCYILFGEEKSNDSNPVFKVGHFIAQGSSHYFVWWFCFLSFASNVLLVIGQIFVKHQQQASRCCLTKKSLSLGGFFPKSLWSKGDRTKIWRKVLVEILEKNPSVLLWNDRDVGRYSQRRGNRHVF